VNILKTALSLSAPEEWNDALNYGADFREIRIDLIKNRSSEEELLRLCCEKKDKIPVIATIRSVKEGGNFSKDKKEWRRIIEPWLDCAEFIDIERDFSEYAYEIKAAGKKIIASVHLDYMPDNSELKQIENHLREYGDIPKIVVTPMNYKDIASFIEFTVEAKKPVITSVMGEELKVARIPLLIMGSMLIFCHSNNQASIGQYHIDDIKKIIEILS
jgi:3-dehydroquinate dehydratase-1